MATTIIYRGDIVPKYVGHAVSSIKTERVIRFVDWCPTGFRCGINYNPSLVLPGGDLLAPQREAIMLSNTTAIAEVFARNLEKADKLFDRKAYLH